MDRAKSLRHHAKALWDRARAFRDIASGFIEHRELYDELSGLAQECEQVADRLITIAAGAALEAETHDKDGDPRWLGEMAERAFRLASETSDAKAQQALMDYGRRLRALAEKIESERDGG